MKNIDSTIQEVKINDKNIEQWKHYIFLIKFKKIDTDEEFEKEFEYFTLNWNTSYEDVKRKFENKFSWIEVLDVSILREAESFDDQIERILSQF